MQHPSRTPNRVWLGNFLENVMLTTTDREKLTKAAQTSSLLMQDILDISRAENALLADIGYELLENMAAFHNRLGRLIVICDEHSNC